MWQRCGTDRPDRAVLGSVHVEGEVGEPACKLDVLSDIAHAVSRSSNRRFCAAQRDSDRRSGSKKTRGLLRQPGGLEGVGVTEPGPPFDALSVTPFEEDRNVLIELNATGKPVPKATEAEHLIAEVVNLGELGVALLGELRQAFEVLTHSSVAAVRTSLHAPFERGRPHDFGIRERDHGFHVAPVPCVNYEQSQVYVLPRHRPRSIPRLGKSTEGLR
jgi:hypothetical protein